MRLPTIEISDKPLGWDEEALERSILPKNIDANDAKKFAGEVSQLFEKYSKLINEGEDPAKRRLDQMIEFIEAV